MLFHCWNSFHIFNSFFNTQNCSVFFIFSSIAFAIWHINIERDCSTQTMRSDNMNNCSIRQSVILYFFIVLKGFAAEKQMEIKWINSYSIRDYFDQFLKRASWLDFDTFIKSRKIAFKTDFYRTTLDQINARR